MNRQELQNTGFDAQAETSVHQDAGEAYWYQLEHELKICDLGEGYCLLYYEVRNGLGGMHPVNYMLCKDNGTVVKQITDADGNFLDFPGIVHGEWERDVEGEFSQCVRFVAGVYPFENGRAKFKWMYQPDGFYFCDDSGFGAEDDVEIWLCSYFDKNGDFVQPFEHIR